MDGVQSHGEVIPRISDMVEPPRGMGATYVAATARPLGPAAPLSRPHVTPCSNLTIFGIFLCMQINF